MTALYAGTSSRARDTFLDNCNPNGRGGNSGEEEEEKKKRRNYLYRTLLLVSSLSFWKVVSLVAAFLLEMSEPRAVHNWLRLLCTRIDNRRSIRDTYHSVSLIRVDMCVCVAITL